MRISREKEAIEAHAGQEPLVAMLKHQHSSLATAILRLLSLAPLVPWQSAHVVELSVGPHVGEVGEPVGHGEKGGDSSDVPGILAIQPVFLKRLEVLLRHSVATAHGHRKVQHGTFTRAQLRRTVVHCHLEKGKITT